MATWVVVQQARIPTIDVAALVASGPARRAADDPEVRRAGEQLVAACEGPGVFQVVGHGVDDDLRRRLVAAARAFFASDPAEKERIAMPLGGRAWRGWFPLGGELTSGAPDGKEGIYFGTELPADDPAVVAGTPLHGPNLFPERPAELGPLVLRWIDEVTDVGRAVLRGLAVGMDLAADWFDAWCADPTVLFRIFHYPAGGTDGSTWGVGEHTDYGLLTLLAEDATGGLEVRVDGEWIAVRPDERALVCNLGDMLERLSGGRFVATPHRVATPTADRVSMPLFLDPGWDVRVHALPDVVPGARRPGRDRWDGEDVHLVDGPYGEYLMSRVARVFPDLFAVVAADLADGLQHRV
ncbi:isopenicillin N synthase family dioxygenase [Dermatobacter hominis]|uniref:isopenicillin N synthase family dioxygenase n=1 Tax=Dermatobacter hominis TaxID=2884263 RepID=UPI001D122131|nr:2-oxoglutarate and iron-dependent oxygenase domain-containing protein [Dermatobacter hominis]UDY35390.1 isopenicillin N synthase family oxygenase [Dermatobacter hominis]